MKNIQGEIFKKLHSSPVKKMGGNTSQRYGGTPKSSVSFVVSYGTQKARENRDGQGALIKICVSSQVPGTIS